MSTELQNTYLDQAMSTYCCPAFWNLVQNSGKQGLAVVPLSELGLQYFCLQSRVCDFAALNKVQDALLSATIDFGSNLILTIQTGIKFCPFCGTNLDEWIAENSDLFERLAIGLKQFLTQ